VAAEGGGVSAGGWAQAVAAGVADVGADLAAVRGVVEPAASADESGSGLRAVRAPSYTGVGLAVVSVKGVPGA